MTTGSKVPEILNRLKLADWKYHFKMGNNKSDMTDSDYNLLRATLAEWNKIEPSDEVSHYFDSWPKQLIETRGYFKDIREASKNIVFTFDATVSDAVRKLAEQSLEMIKGN